MDSVFSVDEVVEIAAWPWVDGEKDWVVRFERKLLSDQEFVVYQPDSKTLMFDNISPDPTSNGESLCSFSFATRDLTASNQYAKYRFSIEYRLILKEK
ncbi:hypothetical protein ACH5RR_027948 [Cinchona calisaya]|uniref:Uncharacterized protein n=1 Tax=Cinchona calisaya TaxID=153742 RepID=A0ABD2YRT3_9GENT